MTMFEFSLVASQLERGTVDLEDHFAASGCSDALISFRKGHIVLKFVRAADTLERAINAAIADARSAGALIKRVEPESLASIADISLRTGLTKDSLSIWSSNKAASGFPGPSYRLTSSMPLWEWRDVACWMVQNGNMHPSEIIHAETIRRVNMRLQREMT